MHSLLFVDDEKAILKSLNRLFFDKGLSLFFAEDGEKALEILSCNKIDMIITDIRMPKMSGYKLLEEVHKLYPETLRFILSGQSDEKEIYKAVFDGSASIYMLKPWEPKRIIDFVMSTFELSDEMKSKNVFDKLEMMNFLPVEEEVKKEMKKPNEKDESNKTLIDFVSNDLGSCARVLKFINASCFDIKVGSIKQAASYLDTNTFKLILSTPTDFSTIVRNGGEKNNYNLIQEQAKLTNKIVRLIYSKIMNKPTPEVALSAGILHNIGMINCFNSEIYQVDSKELSGFILGWWQLPAPIIESAIYYHSPFRATPENIEMVCAIHLADFYAWKFLNKKFGELEQKAFEIFGANQNEFESIL